MNKKDLEDIVLAGACQNQVVARDTCDYLNENDFSDPEFRKIYNAVKEAVQSDDGFSRARLHLILDKKFSNKTIVGMLMERKIPTEDDMLVLIKQLKEVSERDAIAKFGRALEQRANDDQIPMDLLRTEMANAVDIITPTKLRTGNQLSTIGEQFMKNFTQRPDKLLTGWYGLDSQIGGVVKGEMGVLLGRPGTGKTSLALSWSLNVAKMGTGVAFYGFEMAQDKLYEKLLAQYGTIPYFILHERPEDEVMRWQETAMQTTERLEAFPLHIFDETTVPNIDRLEESIRYMVTRYGIEMVVVDYMQLIPVDRVDSEYAAVTLVSHRLRKLAKSCKIFILAISQMNRSIEQRTGGKDKDNKDIDKRWGRIPKLSDARMSGQIEQDAAYVFFLLRRSIEREMEEMMRESNIWVPFSESAIYLAKNRYPGGIGIFDDLTFVEFYSKYCNANWDSNVVEPLGCPSCGKTTWKWIKGRVVCRCGSEEPIQEPDAKSGLYFDSELRNVYGRQMEYETASMHSGFRGDSIIQGIKRLNGSVQMDQLPLRKLQCKRTKGDILKRVREATVVEEEPVGDTVS